MFLSNFQLSAALMLILYIPFHIFEEAAGNFPKWMSDHRWTPDRLSYGHWMASNLFLFYPLLVAALLLDLLCGVRFLGGGILVWGIINFFEHLAYTFLDRRMSHGLPTGALFAADAVLGFTSFSREYGLSAGFAGLSVLAGIVLFFLPILLNIKLHDRFKKYFSEK